MSLNNKQHREMIEKYHQGELSEKEMNSLERLALEDPFLSDAMDGIELLDISIPTEFLNNQIDEKITSPNSNGFYRSFIAPVLIVSLIGFTLNISWSDYESHEVNHHAEDKIISEITPPQYVTEEVIIEEEEELNTAVVLPKKDWIQNLPIQVENDPVEKESFPEPEIISPTIVEEIDSTTELVPPTIKVIKSKKHPVYYIADLKVANYRNFRSGELYPDQFNNSVSAQFENKASHKFEIEKEKRIQYTDYLEKCMKDFSKERYKLAIRGFNHILRNYPNDANALFYSGLSHYNLGLEKKSVELLQQCGNHEFGVFKNESEWYLSLALLKSGRESESKLLMEKIKDENGFYANHAEKMLKTIK